MIPAGHTVSESRCVRQVTATYNGTLLYPLQFYTPTNTLVPLQPHDMCQGNQRIAVHPHEGFTKFLLQVLERVGN